MVVKGLKGSIDMMFELNGREGVSFSLEAFIILNQTS